MPNNIIMADAKKSSELRADNWVTVSGTVNVTTASTFLIIPTGFENASVVSVAVYIKGNSADWNLPSDYGSYKYGFAGMEHFNKSKFSGQGGLAAMPVYTDEKSFDYWSNQKVSIQSNGDIEISTTRTDVVFVPGTEFKYVAVLEV